MIESRGAAASCSCFQPKVVLHFLASAIAQQMRGHLRAAIACEDAFEVHPGGAAGALSGLKIGEVPYVHSHHERSLCRDVEVKAQVSFLQTYPVVVTPASWKAPFAVDLDPRLPLSHSDSTNHL